MTPKSLFLIILRTIGIFILVQSIVEIPQIIPTLATLFDPDNTSLIVFEIIITLTLTILVFLFTVKYLLLKPDMIIEKLSLDKDFDEEKIELNVHSSTVIRIAIIIIGGTTFMDYFVPLLRNIYRFITVKNESGIMHLFIRNKGVDYFDLIEGGLMLLISYLLITNSRRLTNWVERLRRK